MTNIIPNACSCGLGNTVANSTDNTSPAYFYGVGIITADFPSLNVEKEFYQAAPANAPNPPTQRILFDILSKSENLYLAREMCWKFVINGGVTSFLIKPKSEIELYSMISAIEPGSSIKLTAIIGEKGPISTPEMCNGLELPIIICEKVFSYSINSILDNIVNDKISYQQAQYIFSRMIPLVDNTGDTDAFRAINFLSLNYYEIYRNIYTAEELNNDPDVVVYFTGVQSHPSLVQGDSKLIDIIYSYSKSSEQIKYVCRVDISGMYPFLVNPIVPYISYF
jgi:hypothetical protein